MATLLDYLTWRGDLRFAQDPFNDIDALVLAMLSYVSFEDIVPEMDGSIQLEQAAEEVIPLHDTKKKKSSSDNLTATPVIEEELLQLLQNAAVTARFGGIKLSRFVAKTDYEVGQQFAALTYTLPGPKRRRVVAFRGTDYTLIGWKEDFKMAYMKEVPAQESARRYLKDAAGLFSGKVTVCGHSKGGNLAVYAASRLDGLRRGKLARVLSFDGPGFDFSLIPADSFTDCEDKVVKYVPAESIAGMLLNSVGERRVIQSDGHGMNQHDALKWHVQGKDFLSTELAETTLLLEETLQSWLAQITRDKREAFIEALFGIFGASEGKTIDPMDHIKNIGNIIKDISELDEKTKDMLVEVFTAFTEQAKSTITKALKDKLQKDEK